MAKDYSFGINPSAEPFEGAMEELGEIVQAKPEPAAETPAPAPEAPARRRGRKPRAKAVDADAKRSTSLVAPESLLRRADICAREMGVSLNAYVVRALEATVAKDWPGAWESYSKTLGV